MKSIFNRRNLIDFSLVFLFPFLLFVSHYYYYIFIWVAFVPAILLIYRNGFIRLLFLLLPSTILTGLLIAFFIKGFNFTYFIMSAGLYALVLMFFFLSCSLLYKKITSPLSVLIFPLIWLIPLNVCSFIKGFNFWFNFSCLQPMLSPLTWLVGGQGITFLIMLVNSLIAFYIFYKNKRILKATIIILIVLLSCFVYSYLAVPSGKKVKIALIQGNISEDWEWRIKHSASDILETYKRISLEAAQKKPDIIVWPEYTILDENYDEVSSVAKETNAMLIFGSIAKTEQTDPGYNNIKNVVRIFTKDGSYLGDYESFLPFALNGYVIPGDKLPVFESSIGKFSISVCWEETFSFINKNYVKSGADFIINLSNDIGLGNLRAMRLKSTHSMISASENKRYVLKSNNTGYTKVINPYGKTIAELEPNTEGYLIVDIYIK